MPLPLIAVVGYGVSALTAASIAALRAGRAVVPRVARFGPEAPRIVLHRDLLALEDALYDAIAWWAARGHGVTGPWLTDGDTAGPGTVMLIPPPPGWVRTGHLATAQVDAELEDDPDVDDAHEVDAVDGVIRSSTIVLDPERLSRPGIDVARVIAHELGHAAFGYLHVTARLGRKHAHERAVRLIVPKAGHLMHPRYSEGGWGDEGLVSEG
jgi:hypothetical protein